MTNRRRRIVGAIAAGVLVVAVVAGALVRGGDGERLEAKGRASQTTTTEVEPTTAAEPSTDTTLALVPVTTGVPVPTTPTSAAPDRRAVKVTPATASPSPIPAGPPALTGQGAVLTAPTPPPPTRAIDKAKGCHSAVDAGWRVVDCGALRTSGTVLVWLVEGRGKGLRALVLREQAPGQWATVLRAADDDGSRFSAIGVRGEDVSGDGQPELGFGFRRRGGERVLAFDLVDPAGAVAVHRDLPQGSVALTPGQVSTWAATPDGRAEHTVIRHVEGAWRIVATEAVDRTAVPPSMV